MSDSSFCPIMRMLIWSVAMVKSYISGERAPAHPAQCLVDHENDGLTSTNSKLFSSKILIRSRNRSFLLLLGSKRLLSSLLVSQLRDQGNERVTVASFAGQS